MPDHISNATQADPLNDILLSLPRASLGHWPTPLQPLDRLSEELAGPRIWLKRDDCSGLATGGNKTRKLEFLMGDALDKQADVVITFGATQSNHARQTAAAAAQLGLPCHQILSRQVASDAANYEHGGNVLLGKLLGAEQHIVEPNEATEYSAALIAKFEHQGLKVYVIPAGGSNALGALGYSVCAAELANQCAALGINPKHVVHASSSAGTQAGLLYGLSCQNHQLINSESFAPQVLGINVYHTDPARLESAIENLLVKLNDRYMPTPEKPTVNVNHAYFGSAYGSPTNEAIDAIRMAAKLEGILFDPVYSGKALAGLIDQINLGNFSNSDDVILIHTGGNTALHVYEHAF